MIYFDNGATTYPKPKCVINGINSCIKHKGGNPSRSSHRLSLLAGEEVYRTREAVAKMINAPFAENVVFTYNATYALNMAIKTMITEKCHVITSDIEHNSVIRPLKILEKKIGIDISEYNSDLQIEDAIISLIRPDTKAIVSTLASNVTGKEIDFSVLSDIAKRYSLKLIIDASQVAGHKMIDVSDCDCDAICAPAHKALFGIQGAGFVYFKDRYRTGDFIEGGSGTNSIEKSMPSLLPEGYEAGTLGTPSIVALRCGIEFINDIGIENIEHHLNKLRMLVTEGLRGMAGVTLYKSYGGNVIFNLWDMPSHTLAGILDENDIYTRGGLHCAPSAHIKLGTLDRGAVRVSFSIMNTGDEAEYFLRVMRRISEKYKDATH